MTKKTIIRLALAATTFAGLTTAALPAAAETEYSETRGLYLGVSAGFGGSQFQYKESTRSIFEDPTSGGMAGLRFGYAFNNKLALGVAMHGFGDDRSHDQGEGEWGLGAAFLNLTWHPGGHGFFVGGGFGVGGGTFVHPDTEVEVEIRERAAWLFSLGYDWRLGEHTSLGLVVDSMSMSAGGATGYEEDQVGGSGMSIQFTWHL